MSLINEQAPEGFHDRTFNRPVQNCICAIIEDNALIDNMNYKQSGRQVIIEERVSEHDAYRTKRVNANSSSYDPLSYPLFHTRAEKGHTWDGVRKLAYNPDTREFEPTSKFVSLMDFYSFRLHARRDETNQVLRGGLLTQKVRKSSFLKF